MARKIPIKKPPKKALGKPLPEVNEIAPPGEQEINNLVSLWDRYAPRRYAGLMNAESKSVLAATGAKPRGKFVWDEQNLVYIVAKTGRVIGLDELHNALRAFVQRIGSGPGAINPQADKR